MEHRPETTGTPVPPTQVRRPWRATVRTIFAAVVALAAMLPALVQASGMDETLPPVAGALAIAGAVTRIMALPAVEVFLARFLPFLAAEPRSDDVPPPAEPYAGDSKTAATYHGDSANPEGGAGHWEGH